MNFKTKLTKIDILVIIITIALSLMLSFSVYFIPRNNGTNVAIYVMGKNEILLNLNNNKDIEVNLKQGDYRKIEIDNETDSKITYIGYFTSITNTMSIEIINKKIRVSYTECPNRVCINQGWVSTPNVPITCTHNRVIAVIENVNEPNIDIIV